PARYAILATEITSHMRRYSHHSRPKAACQKCIQPGLCLSNRRLTHPRHNGRNRLGSSSLQHRIGYALGIKLYKLRLPHGGQSIVIRARIWGHELQQLLFWGLRVDSLYPIKELHRISSIARRLANIAKECFGIALPCRELGLG